MLKYIYVTNRKKRKDDFIMTNLSSWLIAIFAFMFWVFRVIVAICSSLGSTFVVEPIDMTMEIVLLFITFICICFIVKRKLLPTIIYLLAHGAYYGIYLYNNLTAMAEGQAALDDYMSLLVALVGIAIPVAALFDVLLDKNRKLNPKDKKTDWFYKNEAYDRKFDERADKNNYRLY